MKKPQAFYPVSCLQTVTLLLGMAVGIYCLVPLLLPVFGGAMGHPVILVLAIAAAGLLIKQQKRRPPARPAIDYNELPRQWGFKERDGRWVGTLGECPASLDLRKSPEWYLTITGLPEDLSIHRGNGQETGDPAFDACYRVKQDPWRRAALLNAPTRTELVHLAPIFSALHQGTLHLSSNYAEYLRTVPERAARLVRRLQAPLLPEEALAYDDPLPSVRRQTLLNLLETASPANFSTQLQPLLLRRLLDPDPTVQLVAATILGDRLQLQALAEDPDRMVAAQALGELGYEEALIGRLEGPGRAEAMETLARMGSHRCLPALRALSVRGAEKEKVNKVIQAILDRNQHLQAGGVSLAETDGRLTIPEGQGGLSMTGGRADGWTTVAPDLEPWLQDPEDLPKNLR